MSLEAPQPGEIRASINATSNRRTKRHVFQGAGATGPSPSGQNRLLASRERFARRGDSGASANVTNGPALLGHGALGARSGQFPSLAGLERGRSIPLADVAQYDEVDCDPHRDDSLLRGRRSLERYDRTSVLPKPNHKTRLTEGGCRMHSRRQPRRYDSVGAPIHRRSRTSEARADSRFQTAPGMSTRVPATRNRVRVGAWAALAIEGRREGRVSATPAASVRKKSTGKEPQVWSEQPAFPAQWFDGLFRALPGDRA
jgi:hypothetical protein